MDSKLKKEYEEQLKALTEAYTEVLNLFHNCRHHSVRKELHMSIGHLNEAIQLLEESLKWETKNEYKSDS